MFFATGKHGYTVQRPLEQGKGGVVGGDLLLDVTQEMLKKERLTPSGVAFLFDDEDRILAHPRMSELLEREEPGTLPRLRETDMAGVLRGDPRLAGERDRPAVLSRSGGPACMPRPSRPSLVQVRPVFGWPWSRRSTNSLPASCPSADGCLPPRSAFVAAMVPIVFFIGSLLSRSLQKLADETDRIQRFEPSVAPPVHSLIREIDDLGRSVSRMRTVTETFSRFVPRGLVEKLIETGTPMQLGGARREVTLFFSDIVDFTQITERADPARVMQYTSRYFAAMSHEIMTHAGTVDKFIGDAIMAIWNAPADDPDHAANACAAALAAAARQRIA